MCHGLQDGISDLLERGRRDVIGPGIDSDQDGQPDSLDVDSDNDGIPDIQEEIKF